MNAESTPVPSVPVVILNWNGWEDTFRCLQSLSDCSDVRCVWLVDNGSSLDRSEEARKWYRGELRVLRSPENLGFAGGCNLALRIAASEGRGFAYLLNNDCTVSSGFLGSVLAAALSDSRLAAVGSCITYADSPGHSLFDGGYHPPGVREYTPFGLKDVREVNGAGMLIRLEAMQQVGHFDERFFCYCEETDWCWRALKAGFRVAVNGQSVVRHRREGSDENMNARYYRTRNQFLLIERLGIARRWLWKVRLAWRAAPLARTSYVEGNPAWHAIGAGVRDGFVSRFGKRTDRPAVFSSRLLVGLGHLQRLSGSIAGEPHP